MNEWNFKDNKCIYFILINKRMNEWNFKDNKCIYLILINKRINEWMNQQNFNDFYNLILYHVNYILFSIDILNNRDIMLLWQFKINKYIFF